MTEWVAFSVVLAIHGEQIAEHGGPDGLRDHGLLESALHRPQNLPAHAEPDLADLAACYAWGLASNHPFLDGNKRTSAVVTLLFLKLNGFALDASEAECVEMWTTLAAGAISQSDLATWIRERLVEE
jgi:death-on-curing protein